MAGDLRRGFCVCDRHPGACGERVCEKVGVCLTTGQTSQK